MIKTKLKERLDACFRQGVEQGFWSADAAGAFTVEEPKQASHGDFSTNMAMVIAGEAKKKDRGAKVNPRAMAEKIAALVSSQSDLVQSVEVAGPGFVNMTINPAVWQQVLPVVVAAGESFGRSRVGADRKVMVEFVSANPTGPLSVGHGRQAVLGDVIALLLEATGHDVTREYYFNDAGRQMRVLGESTRARYLELLQLSYVFPNCSFIVDMKRGAVMFRQLRGNRE